MADCKMCGISVVTTNFVNVHSDKLAWKETGSWVGLCDKCLKDCNLTNDTGRSTNKGTCSICDIKNRQLYRVKYSSPSLSGQDKAETWICKNCLKASRHTTINPY